MREEKMAERRTRGNRHAPKGGWPEGTVESPRRRSPSPRDVPETEIDENEELPVPDSAPSLQNDRTIRAELASITREAALEVLGPIARKTTTQAAKYAVSKGPSLAKSALAPRLKGALGPRIEEAGGAGALAKNTLSAVTGKRASVLSRLRGGRGEDEGAAAMASARRLPIHESVDLAVPLEVAFTQFTRFEDFSEFVPEAVKVEQVDEAHLVWHVRLWGVTREWEMEITHQEPNERIAWRSLDGTQATGLVTFHSLSDRLTRVQVMLCLRPHGVLATTASGLGVARRALRADLTRFKAFVELREDDSGDAPERKRRSRQPSRKRATPKPVPKAHDEPDEDEPDEEEYEADDEAEYEPEYEEEYEDEDAEPSATEYEDEDEDEEDVEEGEEDEEPATPRRRVRRRPPARPIRQSRGRS
jgi:uncharacterized membrane protein